MREQNIRIWQRGCTAEPAKRCEGSAEEITVLLPVTWVLVLHYAAGRDGTFEAKMAE